jgi:hypothetical protein
MTDHAQSAAPHQWAGMTETQALNLVLHEMYGPVSALGDQVSRLSDDGLSNEARDEIITHMRARVDDLGSLIILLKRYLDERPDAIAE